MKNRTVHQFNFAQVPTVKHARSVFNRTHGYKTTFDTDYLIPFFVDEALPGDTKNLHCSLLIRLLSPSIKPFMDNLWVDTFWFFCPNRLIWSNFRKFMGEQDNPADSISYNVPQITGPNVAAGGIPIGHLYDYMGLPTGALSGGGATTGITFNNLHGRAYQLIWNQFFRDQNLQNSVTVDLGDGPDTFANYNLLKRGKRHDYFTSALPFLQKGTAVPLPLGTSATVLGSSSELLSGNQVPFITRQSVTGNATPDGFGLASGGTGKIAGSTTAATTAGNFLYFSNLYADLTNATAATINSLRQSITLQQFLENDARGGTRYNEIVRAHFQVNMPDAQWRPELLATYSSPLRITPVAQTSQGGLTGGSTFQGNLAGFGTGSFVGHGFTKSFVEHGVVIGLISVRADLTYQQGMERMWSRRTRYDFYWPEFANLGEQAILNREIYANLADGTGAAQKDGTFGYIPRYDEYRYKPSKITGQLRSTAASSLEVWHLSQNFSSQPTLNSTFIQESVPLDRCIAVPSEPHFILDALLNLKEARPMPVFAVPGLNKL